MSAEAQKHTFRIATLTAFLTAFLAVSSTQQPELAHTQAPYTPGSLMSSLNVVLQDNSYDNLPQLSQAGKVAVRLRTRLRRSGSGISPPLAELKRAVRQRQRLFSARTHVSFITDDSAKPEEWQVSFQQYPLWINGQFTSKTAAFEVNTSAIAQSLESEQVLHVQKPQDAILREVHWSADAKKSSRVVIDGIAKPGYAIDTHAVSETIAGALKNLSGSLNITMDLVPGKIINKSGEDMGDLTLWSTGRSDYRGSDNSRISNVKKALDEHVNDSVVGAGQVFSFNSTLDGAVSQGNGWNMAKVIVNGGDLVYQPGGGICQASTTVYRAALLAGFPVLERKAHSLYVVYYKKYGVGIDATIYPGSQDLSFRNDSKHPLIIQAYHDGTNAYVNIYGTPDGRVATLNGPYFSATAPKEIAAKAGGISSDEIVWLHSVTYADGTIKDDTVSSRYKKMPRSLAAEYPVPESPASITASLAMD